LVNNFQNKNWSRHGLEDLVWATGSIERMSYPTGFGMLSHGLHCWKYE